MNEKVREKISDLIDKNELEFIAIYKTIDFRGDHAADVDIVKKIDQNTPVGELVKEFMGSLNFNNLYLKPLALSIVIKINKPEWLDSNDIL